MTLEIFYREKCFFWIQMYYSLLYCVFGAMFFLILTDFTAIDGDVRIICLPSIISLEGIWDPPLFF